MQKISLLFLVCLIISVQGKSQTENSSNSKEPKATFDVTVNGKKYSATEGEEIKIDSLIKPVISIQLANYKKFQNSAISFDYPKNLSFDYNEDYAYKNWTLTGNSVVILIFELDTKTSLSTLTEAMIKKFGKKNCTLEDIEQVVGKKKLTGQRLHVTLAGQKLNLDCFEIPSADFKSRFIYFQDSIESEEHSAEYEKVFALLNSTFQYK